ncbi:hypothetical protein Pmar_PMAR001792 [Perkinsus marinus ATCC 50983]|uniref:Mic1 domain-containing protein n=1 Tax=Perkinsus marinus (strain ATCC 50983 / TXsc) TaxID=423536 RepID=C5LJN0_PERM5|nr:hypothetical protein Pmar_PMAR001792 [Perkinsus marinus ATCC 50983]EER03047.1 hypothetical protein Pmar_PMAR001792 [Perkinsus marinus ATCC 50983]|eukprot:XP_002771231.1 hypothetical protein Pmar_PMAR001792 [Perkinsus marinus ATCC 50983]
MDQPAPQVDPPADSLPIDLPLAFNAHTEYVEEEEETAGTLYLDYGGDRIVHVPKGKTGFFLVTLGESNDGPRFVTIPEGAPLAEHVPVRVSPCGNFFAYATAGPIPQLLIARMGAPSVRVIEIPLAPGVRIDTIVDVLWVRHEEAHSSALQSGTALPIVLDSYMLVVVSHHSLDVLRLSSALKFAKPLRRFPLSGSSSRSNNDSRAQTPATVRHVWYEPDSGICVLCINQRTLQPFDLKPRLRNPQLPSVSPKSTKATIAVKMPKFDLYPADVHNPSDCVDEVSLLRIDSVASTTSRKLVAGTYICHVDSAAGRLSLRNLSVSGLASPEHDAVIQLPALSRSTGRGLPQLAVHVVDGLICVSRSPGTSEAVSPTWYIYDIYIRGSGRSLPLVPPFRLDYPGAMRSPDILRSSQNKYVILADDKRTMVYGLELQTSPFVADLMSSASLSMLEIATVLLRRQGCRDELCQTLRYFLSDRDPSPTLEELAYIFDATNASYRECIERTPLLGGESGAMVSLARLLESAGSRTILTEVDAVDCIFHPVLCSILPDCPRPPLTAGSTELLRYGLECTPESSCLQKLRKLLSQVLIFCRSLLALSVYPHRRVQLFLFDLCVVARQQHWLQQLLHYHVLLDSAEIVERLDFMWRYDIGQSDTRSISWSQQCMMDMAWRLLSTRSASPKLIELLTEALLDGGDPVDVVAFLRQQTELGGSNVPLIGILERAEELVEEGKVVLCFIGA